MILLTRFLCCLSVLLVACGPRHTIQKYAYLTEGYSPRTQPTSPASPAPPATAAKPPTTKSVPSTLVPVLAAPTGSMTALETTTVIRTALSYEGTPYRYGGMSSQGMDCSGLVYTAYQAVDRTLPRRAIDMAHTGKAVKQSNIQPGNLVFFDSKGGGRINHVGLVVSVEGKAITFIHASTSRGVRQDLLTDPYWQPRFRKAVAL